MYPQDLSLVTLSIVLMQMQAALLDWNEEYTGPKFNLVLACDVLYEAGLSACDLQLESVCVLPSLSKAAVTDLPLVISVQIPGWCTQDFSVEPLGKLLPQLLSDNGQVLLADPSERTRHNRQAATPFSYFVPAIKGASPTGTSLPCCAFPERQYQACM